MLDNRLVEILKVTSETSDLHSTSTKRQ
jgi:hypothetical protein